MSERKDFFALLRSKLTRTPDRNFDQRFWNRFDREFGREPARPRAGWRVWLPGLLAASLILAVSFTLWKSARQETAPWESPEEDAVVMAVSADGDFLANLDVYDEIEEMPTDEEDWAVLLPEDAV